MLFAILLYVRAYAISLNLIFFLFEAKNEQMELHFAETDEITTGAINNLKNVYLLCNYVLLVGTLAFTARQYCFKQQEQWRDQICLQTISHKLDSRSDIIFLNICQMVLLCSWLELLILFVYLFDF